MHFDRDNYVIFKAILRLLVQIGDTQERLEERLVTFNETLDQLSADSATLTTNVATLTTGVNDLIARGGTGGGGVTPPEQAALETVATALAAAKDSTASLSAAITAALNVVPVGPDPAFPPAEPTFPPVI